MWGCTLVSANTHFIALDFRVCDVILRKTLGFDKLSKDSQVKIRWRIQRISRITGSLWHGTWHRRPGSRPKCSDTSSLLSQPSASSNALEPWSQKFPTDCWTPQSGPSTPSQRLHCRQSAPRCKTCQQSQSKLKTCLFPWPGPLLWLYVPPKDDWLKLRPSCSIQNSNNCWWQSSTLETVTQLLKWILNLRQDAISVSP